MVNEPITDEIDHPYINLKIEIEEGEEIKVNEIREDLPLVANLPVPPNEDAKIKYFFTICSLSEKYLHKKKVSKEDVEHWRTISYVLRDYVRANRETMKKSDRKFLWIIKCRVDYLLILQNIEVFNKLDDMLNKSETRKKIQQYLIMPQGRISDYSISIYWQALSNLVYRIVFIPYTKLLNDYIKMLYCKCCKFLSVATPRIDTMDYEFLRKPANGGDPNAKMILYSVNSRFMIETERIFFGFEESINFHLNVAKEIIPMKPESSDMKRIFRNIVTTIASDPIYEKELKRFVRDNIYDQRICVGEVDRFKDEFKNLDCTGYIIATKYREDTVKLVSNILAHNMPRKVLDRHELFFHIAGQYKSEYDRQTKFYRRKNNEPVKVNEQDEIDEYDPMSYERECKFFDIEYNLMCIQALTYYLSRIEDKFKFEHFVFLKSKKKSLMALKISDRFPVLIQSFNTFNILYKNKLYVEPDFETCFIHWVQLVATDKSINGVLFDTKGNISSVYQMFFPDNKSVIHNINKDADNEFNDLLNELGINNADNVDIVRVKF